MRHQHHWLEAPGLPGAGDGQVVPHKARVNLAVIHGAGVHVLGLCHLHQLDLLAGQGVGQAAQDGHVKQGDDGQGEGPADPAVTQLVVIRLERDIIKSFVKSALFIISTSEPHTPRTSSLSQPAGKERRPIRRLSPERNCIEPQILNTSLDLRRGNKCNKFIDISVFVGGPHTHPKSEYSSQVWRKDLIFFGLID